MDNLPDRKTIASLATVRHMAEVEQRHAKEELVAAISWMRSTLAEIERNLESGLNNRSYIQDKDSRIDVSAQRLYDASKALEMLQFLESETN